MEKKVQKKRTDRRIPADQRKRAAASCDNCKVKRNKCLRAHPDAPCKACQDTGITCKYTIPRKRRVSSEVKGQRKYEYVDPAFYKPPDSAEDNESTKSTASSIASNPPPSSSLIDNSTPVLTYPSNIPPPPTPAMLAQGPLVPQPPHAYDSSSAPSSSTPAASRPFSSYHNSANFTTQQQAETRPSHASSSPMPGFSIENFYQFLQGPQPHEPHHTYQQQQHSTQPLPLPPSSSSSSSSMQPSATRPTQTSASITQLEPQSSAPAAGSMQQQNVSANTGFSTVSNRPPTPPSSSSSSYPNKSGTIPMFANKLRYIGLHGSYSFLVQVRQLFSESDGVEGHNVGPQTMGGGDTSATGGSSSGSGSGPSAQAKISDIPILPERQFADALLETYFQTIHRDFPLFHRESFQQVYNQVWQPGAPSVGASWLVCIYMVFVLAAEIQEYPMPDGTEASKTKDLQGHGSEAEQRQYSTQNQQKRARCQFQDKYVKLVSSVMMQVLSGTSLIDVQAVMMYVLYLFLTGQRDASWSMLGAAVRIAVGIGLHRGDAGFKLGSLERELRKRVWWTMYVFERMECSSLGRPSCIDDFDCTVDFPRDGFLDNAYQSEGGYIPQGLICAHINLSMILGNISKRFYLSDVLSSENIQMASDLYERLLLWRDQLPYSLRHGTGLSEMQYRQMVLLHATFHYTVCFLMRPYLVYMASSTTNYNSSSSSSPNISKQDEERIQHFATLCASNALECKNFMHKLHEIGRFNQKTWIDVYFVYYSTLILSTQALALAKQNKHTDFNSIKDHVIANDILFDTYTDKAKTMERFTQVAMEVSKILRQVVGNRLLGLPISDMESSILPQHPPQPSAATVNDSSSSLGTSMPEELSILAPDNWFGI